jgi:hypothetical protein
MKKLLFISLLFLVMVITLSTAFVQSRNIKNKDVQANMVHPEAGYIESIGN